MPLICAKTVFAGLFQLYTPFRPAHYRFNSSLKIARLRLVRGHFNVNALIECFLHKKCFFIWVFIACMALDGYNRRLNF